MRANYWSCSAFATWLRGTKKPQAESASGWRSWKNAAKLSHPFRFWVAEELLDRVQNFIHWPTDQIYNVKYYINNRWVTKTHQLTAHKNDIKPGEWRDVGNRFLPCLFNELVDFVEIEQAWHHIVWMEKVDRVKYSPPLYATGWFHWRTWRCPEAGLDHLKWAASLIHDDSYGMDKNNPLFGTPTSQAVTAQEMLFLYNWWKVTRPARKDPYDESGWSELLNRRRGSLDDFMSYLEDRNEEERDASRAALAALHAIEKRYEDEDEEMMIRLIKIRQGLWT